MEQKIPAGDERQPSLERHLATIMMADVAGYSRMMGEDEERTVRILRGHREVFDALLVQHRGRIFNTAGDAILAEFPSAVEAVRCATEIQAALRTRNEHLPEEQRMWFRIGVNLGDVIVQGDDLLGDGVNVAARIQSIAEPGGVCISGSVYDQIQNKLSLQFNEMGERSFKNIARPIRTFSIAELDEAALSAVAKPTRRMGKLVRGGVAAVVLLAAVAGGYWGFHEYDTRRAEELRRAVEVERQAAEAQRKAAEEQLALEAQQRQAKAAEARERQARLEAEAQAAKEALERTEAEKKRLDQELKREAAERRASEKAPDKAAGEQLASPKTSEPPRTVPAPAAVPPARELKGRERFDGTYDGQLCNERPVKLPGMRCWPVVLRVEGGKVLATWSHVITGKEAAARGTIAPDGTVQVTLEGWLPNGKPVEGTMFGRWEKNVITLSGKWKTGLSVSGTWKRGS